jgi:hypothetical protein
MDCKSVKFSRHVIERMFTRRIAAQDILDVLRHGESVEEYPDDTPFPAGYCWVGAMIFRCM